MCLCVWKFVTLVHIIPASQQFEVAFSTIIIMMKWHMLTLSCHTVFAYCMRVSTPKGKCTVTKFYDTHNIFHVGKMLQAKESPIRPFRCITDINMYTHTHKKRKSDNEQRRHTDLWKHIILDESGKNNKYERKKAKISSFKRYSLVLLHDWNRICFSHRFSLNSLQISRSFIRLHCHKYNYFHSFLNHTCSFVRCVRVEISNKKKNTVVM